MMKLKLLITLFLIGLMSQLNAFELKESSLYYLKLGAAYSSDDSGVLPHFGLGARFQKDQYGFDLSANLNSMIFMNHISLKGLFLFYPYPKNKNQFYFGVGPGIGYRFSSVPMGQPYGCASDKQGYVAIEGIVGYEFRHSRHFKTFVQLEMTQPFFGFGGKKYHRNNKPGFAISAGMGF